MFSEVLNIQTKLLTLAQQSFLTPMLSPNPHFEFFETVFCSPCWSGARFEDQAGLDIVISSDLPSKCWNYTLEPNAYCDTHTHMETYIPLWISVLICVPLLNVFRI